MASGTAKVLSKSSLRPVQKVGIVIAASVVGAGVQVGVNAINSISETSNSSSTVDNSNIDNTLKFIGDSDASPLVNLILSINAIIGASLTLVIILFNIILYQYILNENSIKLNLFNFISIKLNYTIK
jgi:hypothetical protein